MKTPSRQNPKSEGRNPKEIRNPNAQGLPKRFAPSLLDLVQNGFNFHRKETKVTKARRHLNRCVPSSWLSSLASLPSVQRGCILWFSPPRFAFRPSDFLFTL